MWMGLPARDSSRPCTVKTAPLGVRLSSEESGRSSRLLFLLLVVALVLNSAEGIGPYDTLTAQTPLIVARGGASNQFPDMTQKAYELAIANGANYIHCGLVMSNDNQGICRPSLDLGKNTDILGISPLNERIRNTTIDGSPVLAYFALSYNLRELRSLKAIQPNQQRTAAFDGYYPILTATQALDIALQSNVGFYLEMLAPEFHNANGANMTEYVIALFRYFGYTSNTSAVFVASSELAPLQTIKASLDVPLVFQLLGKDKNDTEFTEPSTKKHYGQFVTPAGLRQVASVASGILVDKNWIIPQDYLAGPGTPQRVSEGVATQLRKNAHAAGLQVHVAGLANDDPNFSWLYGGDYTTEYEVMFNPVQSSYVVQDGDAADAVLTDFVSSAAFALNCYPLSSKAAEAGRYSLPRSSLVIADGSDKFPAQTGVSFQSALNDGADAIYCYVQLSKDGVPFCRLAPDLTYDTSILADNPGISPVDDPTFGPGIFSFDFPIDVILNLTGVQSDISRSPLYDGQFPLITLESFLQVPASMRDKDHPNFTASLLIDLQFPTFYAKRNLSMVDAVLAVVEEHGTDPSIDTIYLQSYEARTLQQLKNRTRLPLVQRIDTLGPDPSTGHEYTFYLSDAGLKSIAEYAKTISVYKEIYVPVYSYNGSNPFSFFLNTLEDDTIARAHKNGLKFFTFKFQNEPSALEWDYLGDPIIQLKYFNFTQSVDGFFTEFPQTASGYFDSGCGERASGDGYSIPNIVPGSYLDLAMSLRTPSASSAPQPSLSPSSSPSSSPNNSPSISPSSNLSSSPLPSVSPPSSLLAPPPPKGASCWAPSYVLALCLLLLAGAVA